jgi:hypothetical protein
VVERLQKRLVTILASVVGAALLILQSGCTTTASQPVNAFQPRPFQSQGLHSQYNNAGYTQQQAFYSPYAQQQYGAPANFQNFGMVGLDLRNSGQYQAGYQPPQTSPWSGFGSPNVRSLNPPGFALPTC